MEPQTMNDETRKQVLEEAARLVCHLCAEGGALVWTHIDCCSHEVRTTEGRMLLACTASAIWNEVMAPEERVVAS